MLSGLELDILKSLRHFTGASFDDCKEIMDYTGWDFELSERYLVIMKENWGISKFQALQMALQADSED